MLALALPDYTLTHIYYLMTRLYSIDNKTHKNNIHSTWCRLIMMLEHYS